MNFFLFWKLKIVLKIKIFDLVLEQSQTAHFIIFFNFFLICPFSQLKVFKLELDQIREKSYNGLSSFV